MTAKRALLIGSQTGGLTGVHSDVEVMDDALSGLGFTTTRCTEGDATYDGIMAAYRGLIEDTSSGDAAVVYYSGHGGRTRNALAQSDPAAPAWLQHLVPTDFHDRSGGRFRAVLAEELSLLQLQLTEKTPNVTTILDCCHSARMSRDVAVLPKAVPAEAADHVEGFPWADVDKRWAAARGEAGAAAAADANPLAVRLVACSPDESAYELATTRLGGPHGALTAVLVPLLKSAGVTSRTWRDLIDAVRPAVMDMLPQQRPELEGPLHRLLFATDERPQTGVVPIRIEDGAALLDGAEVFGMVVGDTYAVVEPGGDPGSPVTVATIERIVAGRAVLALGDVDPLHLAPGVAAHPVRVSLGARPVAVVPADAPGRAQVVAALEGSTFVRPVDRAAGVLATVELSGGVRLLDAGGLPLHAAARPMSEETLASLADDLVTLARATHLRELASGEGDAALPDDVGIAWSRLAADGAEHPLDRSGAHLFNGDRIVARLTNNAAEDRFVSIIDLGISGGVSLLTTSEPDGVTLAPGEEYVLGGVAGGAVKGIELYWPPSIPGGAPRPETVVAVVADDKITGLARLEQKGVVAAKRDRGAASELERLIDGLGAGRRDARPPAAEAGPKPTRYRVQRLEFLLHESARSGEADEPAFEIDERPDPSFRLVTPRSADAPGRVAVRLRELTVHSNRSILKAAVRVDALVVTAPPEGAGEPYRAATARFDRVKDGDRLPFDNLLVYEGPVGRFVDLAVWVSKDSKPDLDLAEMLAAETGSDDVKKAVVALAGLALAAPQAALVAGSAAAVSVLVRTAARVLDVVQGTSIGVYRTSLLPHERFGAGPAGSAGLHPPEGLLRAQDMSFAYEVVPLA